MFRVSRLGPLCHSLVVTALVTAGTAYADSQVIPGTGQLVNTDDFEDTNWNFTFNWPKSSKEEDENIRYPLGQSSNRMWFESPKRGIPDVVKRVDTPTGGIAGSKGSLLIRTRDCGVPNAPGHKQAQDDIIMAAKPMSVSYTPSFTVRVYLPEWSQWEQRLGVTFGIRMGLQGPRTKEEAVGFGKFFNRTRTVTETEPYYPGFFIQFCPKTEPSNPLKKDFALLLLRSDGMGHEIIGPRIFETGWWTFGMTVTPDGRCHYYASPGVDDLKEKDYITSAMPYNIPAQTFNTIFFNVCSPDNAQTWSTPWIIDDPKVFYIQGSGSPLQTAKAAQNNGKMEF